MGGNNSTISCGTGTFLNHSNNQCISTYDMEQVDALNKRECPGCLSVCTRPGYCATCASGWQATGTGNGGSHCRMNADTLSNYNQYKKNTEGSE